MFYRKIDVRKLYEAMDEPVQMEGDPGVVMGDEMVGSTAEDPQAAESFEKAEEPKSDPNKEAVNAMKGQTYAYPVSKEDHDQLMQLIGEGSGEWVSKQPLKTINNEDAMMQVGGENKPVYLKIVLTQTKGERLAAPTKLEDPDRVYVALNTSANDLRSNLETAVNITNYVKLTVKTPLLKSGTNIEHSLNMWKDFESEPDQDINSPENNSNDMSDIDKIQKEQPGLAAQLNLPESRRRFVNGKWTSINESYKMIRDEAGGNARWLYNDSTKTATYVSSPEKYKELVAKHGMDGKSVPMSKSEIDAAVQKGKAPVVVDDLSKVEAGTSLKSGRTGRAVEEIQKMLGIDADGKFGPKTKDAVQAFQRENGLTADGIVGPKTLEAIKKKQADAAAEAKAKADADAKAKADADAAAAADAKAKADADAAAAADAKAKADAASNTPEEKEDDKKLEDMSAEELRSELDRAKQELKSAKQEDRQERRGARQDRREDRKDARQARREDRKEDRLQRRVEKIQKKIERATNESKIYNFEDFVKIVHGLQGKK